MQHLPRRHKIRLEFENHLLVFFTGITRDASSVLKEQKVNINKKMFTLKQMADSVFEFKTLLESGNFKEMGKMLHQGWLRKKSLASKISSGFISLLKLPTAEIEIILSTPNFFMP